MSEWRNAIREELARYQNETGQTELTLEEFYDFSLSRLTNLFPNNNHPDAKIRQQLQVLRDNDEIEFVDDDGLYRINSLDIDEANTGTSELRPPRNRVTETSENSGGNDQTQIFIAPVANEHAQEHLRRTVIQGVPANLYEDYTDGNRGDPASVWGISRGGADKYGDKMEPGDILLFYTGDREYTYMATIAETEENPELSKAIWDAYSGTLRRDDSDNPWPFIIYLRDGKSIHLSSTELHEDAGWGRDYPIAFSRFNQDDVEDMTAPYGSVRAYLRAKRSAEPQPPEEEEQEAEEELEEQLDEEPQLTEDETEYTEVKRRARSSAFQSKVREEYENTCAICGSQRESPVGTPEVEAAHIYPKSESGSDDPRNGLALCRLHHWAFDTGWLSVTDDYEILVRDRPNQNGYDEFKELEGEHLNLPDDEEYHPHSKFLAAHRELHGFE